MIKVIISRIRIRIFIMKMLMITTSISTSITKTDRRLIKSQFCFIFLEAPSVTAKNTDQKAESYERETRVLPRRTKWLPPLGIIAPKTAKQRKRKQPFASNRVTRADTPLPSPAPAFGRLAVSARLVSYPELFPRHHLALFGTI